MTHMPHDPPYTAAEVITDLERRGVIPARPGPAAHRLPLVCRLVPIVAVALWLVLAALLALAAWDMARGYGRKITGRGRPEIEAPAPAKGTVSGINTTLTPPLGS